VVKVFVFLSLLYAKARIIEIFRILRLLLFCIEYPKKSRVFARFLNHATSLAVGLRILARKVIMSVYLPYFRP
jgi:hypothetical protein